MIGVCMIIGGCCGYAHPTESHLKLKSREISFACTLYLSCRIIMQFALSVTLVLRNCVQNKKNCVRRWNRWYWGTIFRGIVFRNKLRKNILCGHITQLDKTVDSSQWNPKQVKLLRRLDTKPCHLSIPVLQIGSHGSVERYDTNIIIPMNTRKNFTCRLLVSRHFGGQAICSDIRAAGIWESVQSSGCW